MNQIATRENYALAVSNAIWVLDELGEMRTKIMNRVPWICFKNNAEMRPMEAALRKSAATRKITEIIQDRVTWYGV